MNKSAPSIREIKAARVALRSKIYEKAASSAGRAPTNEENESWKDKHQSPMRKYQDKKQKAEEVLRRKADELLLAAEMGQITSEDFYKRVTAF